MSPTVAYCSRSCCFPARFRGAAVAAAADEAAIAFGCADAGRADGAAYPQASAEPVPAGDAYRYQNSSPGQSESVAGQSLLTAVPRWTGAPLAYPASRDEAALRVEQLMHGRWRSAVRGSSPSNGPVQRRLYDRAGLCRSLPAAGLNVGSPRRPRAGKSITTVIWRSIRRRQPQVRDEVVLYEQSGRSRSGEAEAASSRYGVPIAAAVPLPVVPPATPSSQQIADSRLSLAQDAFESRDYESALLWARNAYREMPQARTLPLMAQIFLAEGDVRDGAAEARAAVAMAPTVDWQTLFNNYSYVTPRFSRQLHALEEFVRLNPSSADGHFLLGYERLILGKADSAHAELAIASVIEPTDVAATALLAKEGVEIVGSHRPLAEAAAPRTGVEVARRVGTPPLGVGPWSTTPAAPAAQPTTESEVTR